MTFDNCDTFPFAQIFYNFAYIGPQLMIDYLAAILRSKYYMIFAHVFRVRQAFCHFGMSPVDSVGLNN